jgi:hypothetical protein
MCLVAFGEQLMSINGDHVPPQFTREAKDLKGSLRPELAAGKIVSRLRPLALVDMAPSDPQFVEHVDDELLSATSKVRDLSPADQRELERLRVVPRPPRASVATVCSGLMGRGSAIVKKVPNRFAEQIMHQLADLRARYRAEEVKEVEDLEQVDEEEEEIAAELNDLATQSGHGCSGDADLREEPQVDGVQGSGEVSDLNPPIAARSEEEEANDGGIVANAEEFAPIPSGDSAEESAAAAGKEVEMRKRKPRRRYQRRAI